MQNIDSLTTYRSFNTTSMPTLWEAVFSPTSLAIKFKFGNMQSISWNKLALWHCRKLLVLRTFIIITIHLTSQKLWKNESLAEEKPNPSWLQDYKLQSDHRLNNSSLSNREFLFEITVEAWFSIPWSIFSISLSFRGHTI